MSQTKTSETKKSDMDFRSTTNIQREENFICKMFEDRYQSTLYPFISKILFNLIDKSKNLGFKHEKIKHIIDHWIFKLSNGNILSKFGYKCSKGEICDNILKITNVNDFLKFNKDNNISFSELMGAMYKFTIDNEITGLCLDNDTELQKKFMDNVSNYFSIPSDLSYEEIKEKLASSTSNNKWFNLWVISLLGNNVKNLFHGNLINEEDYIRKWNKSLEFSQSKQIKDYNTIHQTDVIKCKINDIKNMLDNEDDSQINDIMLGNSYTIPTTDSFWFKLMKDYNKEVIAGPSSSSVLTYQMIFVISKVIEDTDENKLLLLLCILLHYYQYSHSISEVLQQYCPEAYFEKYTLDLDDIDYIKFLIEKYGKKPFGSNKRLYIKTKRKTSSSVNIGGKNIKKKTHKHKGIHHI